MQVRRKGRYLAQTFRRKKDAESWALEAERSIDRGREPRAKLILKVKTFGDLIDLHKADMREVKRPLRRSKLYSLNLLDRKLGRIPFRSLGREQLIAYGRDRAHEGAGPVTLAAELSYTGTILGHAAAVHGIDVSREDVDLARIALRRLGLIGRGTERDRRPTQQELDDLIAFFDGNSRQVIPVGRIIRFAVASAMRVSEISNILWSDIDTRLRIVIVRDRKDPRRKEGNNQRVPLISLTGYNAWSILQEQRLVEASNDRIFPTMIVQLVPPSAALAKTLA